MPIPDFSIIIPTLNEEKYLPALLDDIGKQSYQNFEVLIVDGASKDRTPAIVQSLALTDRRVRLLSSRERGVGHQRNLGAKEALGKVLLFLDADNRLPSYFLEGIHYRLAQHPCDVFTTWSAPDSKNPQDKAVFRAINAVMEGSAKMGQPMAYGACLGIKPEVFKALSGFDEKITLMEDFDLVRRAVKAGYYFICYRDPVFTVSLRRYRKDGTLRFYRQMLPFAIKQLTGQKITGPVPSYPMLGGEYFAKTNRKKKESVLQYKELIKRLVRIQKSQKQKVKQLMQELFD